MEKGLVLYRSKYGAARTYAELLSRECSCEVRELSDCGTVEWEQYHWVVFAGGVFAGGIEGLAELKRKLPVDCRQKLIVFCAGAMPGDDATICALREHNLPGDWSTVPLFYGRGIWDLERMTWLDRTLCRMLQKSLQKKPPEACTPGMETLKNAAVPCDWTDRSYLVPLLRFLEKQEGTI